MEKNNLIKDRAWIEIDLNNLEHNIKEIKRIIHLNTKIMAVVKADAYGHGAVIITKKLEEIGISDFAVATLAEAIELRENNIKGNILILGYTSVENIKYVIKYDLIQTIIDYAYSIEIKKLNLKDKLKCHIKINTGMNRLGECYDDVNKLCAIYENDRLNILGTYSHLSAADSCSVNDINFTKVQINRFDECISILKNKGYNVGKLHLQSSYAIINYNELNLDFVRPGIFIYGLNSDKNSYQAIKLNLKPVLSLKARITGIKNIKKGDCISYARSFIATKDMRIASLSIGYADGISRCLSNMDMLVKIRDKYAKVIGRICMDQMIIDISGIDRVKQGDIVIVIGNDANLSCEEVACKANTITNELLSGFGKRIRRVIVQKST